ncbi:hypothetical protein [Streptomyces nojiriensis]|uniref:hypothetical protein n=1 Tax=Streptomyces nojiriensis TaxID=66374 RepID=UPI00368B3C97
MGKNAGRHAGRSRPGAAAGRAGAYSRTLHLEDGDPHPGWSFEEIQTELLQLGDRWKNMRGLMRADLGVSPGPAAADA